MLKKILLPVMIAGLLIMTACSKPEKGEGVLHLSTNTTFTMTDPHYTAQNADYYLAFLLYESFYDLDNLGNLTPRLATSYDVSADGLTFTYHLKQGVKWQTGGDFTSADVMYTMGRAMQSPYMMQHLGYVANYSAPDNYTVVFELAALSPTFHIDINRVCILGAADAAKHEPGFTNQLPGGTGPYTLDTFNPDTKVIVKRNPAYHGSAAPIAEIDFTVFGDSNAAMRAFEAGELDYVNLQPLEYKRISDTGRYKTYVQDTINTTFVCMNNEVAPFDNPLVRQAFNYAVDKKSIIYATLEDFGTPANTLGNSNLVFGLPKAGEIFEYEFNQQKARELLAEAGYPNGLTLSEPLIFIGAAEYPVLAQVLQSQLAQVGVNFEIRMMEQSALVEDIILGNYSLGILGINLDVDASMFSLVYCTDYIGAMNLARYSNELVDELFYLAGSTLNTNARIGYYNEAFDIASRDAAYLPLYSQTAGFASVPNLESSVYTNFYYWRWND